MAEGSKHHLAQYNVAKLVAPLDDPRLAEFRARLDEINQLGDRSPGFVWRHQNADGNSKQSRAASDTRFVRASPGAKDGVPGVLGSPGAEPMGEIEPRWASQPASKWPRYFATSAAGACRGKCGHVNATYEKNGCSA